MGTVPRSSCPSPTTSPPAAFSPCPVSSAAAPLSTTTNSLLTAVGVAVDTDDCSSSVPIQKEALLSLAVSSVLGGWRGNVPSMKRSSTSRDRGTYSGAAGDGWGGGLSGGWGFDVVVISGTTKSFCAVSDITPAAVCVFSSLDPQELV